MSFSLAAATPDVTSVTAQQRYPWNGKVDIVVTFSGASNDVAQVACAFGVTNSATKSALPVTHVTPVEEIVGSGTTWTRRFVWDAAADVGEVKIPDLVLAVEVRSGEAEMSLGGIQLWENGPYWAEYNVGATKPEEYGYYFWWGDTVGYKRNASNDGWVSSQDGLSFTFSRGNCPTYGMDDSTLQSQGYIDSTGNLVAKYDAATAHLGAPWRMPTDAECSALFNNCTTTWTTRNGVYGRLVTGKGAYASKSIFLPAAGCGSDSNLKSSGLRGQYIYSTPYTFSDVSYYAWYLYFDSGEFYRNRYGSRDFGQSVRPLRGFTSAVMGGAAMVHLTLDTRMGVRYARSEEPITFSTEWNTGVTQLVLNVDGNNVLTAAMATNGVYVWKPDLSTSRAVTLKHITTWGTVSEVLTASFSTAVPYIYVDAVAGDDNRDCSMADKALKTLTRAYELAEPGDVILVAAGTYGPVTATGKTVTFRGADGAVIDGGGTSRCVTADDDVVFENFTIQNGYDTEVGGGVWGGKFERCMIHGCVSEWDGGGAYEAALRNCVIVGNEAVHGRGGGVYGGTLDHCVVQDNIAGNVGGGSYEPVSLSETSFYGNSPEDTADVGGTVTAGGLSIYVPSGSSTIYPISHDWLIASGLAKVGDSTAGLDTKLAAPYAPGFTGWEAFVAGLTAKEQILRAGVEIFDGEVHISWSPNLNTDKVTRIYTVYGRMELEAGDWVTPVQPWHRFFKVAVAMPTGGAGEKTAVSDEGFIPEELGGVQLWENGPYWAECNVGASNPEEFGYYFCWGDTEGYKRNASNDGWVAIKNGTLFSFSGGNCPTYNKSNSKLQLQGYIDSTGSLAAKYDAATVHLGAPWRMPTSAEIDALISNCTTTWMVLNGVRGRLVTGKGAYASKSIFLPAAGYGSGSYLYSLGTGGNFWSSTPDSGMSSSTWNLYLNSSYFFRYYDHRYLGQSVRPLRGFSK
ncbi:MAG: hypothetical protein MJ240_12530 [Kiritimatiellae bacterium]|nr:hypothetical protein [Kiritimatiellia bacterium]